MGWCVDRRRDPAPIHSLLSAAELFVPETMEA
jgi:hypothetical protein